MGLGSLLIEAKADPTILLSHAPRRFWRPGALQFVDRRRPTQPFYCLTLLVAFEGHLELCSLLRRRRPTRPFYCLTCRGV